MRLASFNMRAGGSRTHWSALLDAINPDICFAQETKSPASFPADVLDAYDLTRAVWRGVDHRKWGSALLVNGGTIAPIAFPEFDGWVVGGEVTSHGTEFLAFSIHVPGGRGSYVHCANAILDRLAPVVRGAPLLIAGDWNVTVGVRQADEPRVTHPSELKLLDRLASEFGVVSTWSIANPDRPLPQTLRWAREPIAPYHCDGIFIPNAWAARLRSARVVTGEPWNTLSDHNPIVAEIDPA